MVVTVVEGLCLPLLLADIIQHRKQGGAASEQVSQLSRAGGELVYMVMVEFFWWVWLEDLTSLGRGEHGYPGKF